MMSPVTRLINRSKDFLFLPALTPLWRNRMKGRILCLLYHRVEDPDTAPWLTAGGCPLITPEELATDLRFLRDQGARFLTFAELHAEFPVGSDEFGVVVSFDDGFDDNYRVGLAVLEDLGIRGVICQSSGLVDATDLSWEHTLYWFNRAPAEAATFHALACEVFDDLTLKQLVPGKAVVTYLREQWDPARLEILLAQARQRDPAQTQRQALATRLYPGAARLRQAATRNHEIGSHGHHHYKRANLDASRFETDLVASLDLLESILQVRPTLYSYPFNSYLDGDHRICGRHVQQVATVDGGFIAADSDPLRLPRVTWPGPARSANRHRRWLLTGTF